MVSFFQISNQPQVSAETLMEQLRQEFERLCRGVADAVNQAPPLSHPHQRF